MVTTMPAYVLAAWLALSAALVLSLAEPQEAQAQDGAGSQQDLDAQCDGELDELGGGSCSGHRACDFLTVAADVYARDLAIWHAKAQQVPVLVTSCADALGWEAPFRHLTALQRGDYDHTAVSVGACVQCITHCNIALLFCQNGAKNRDLRCRLHPAPSDAGLGSDAGCRCWVQVLGAKQSSESQSSIRKLHPISFMVFFHFIHGDFSGSSGSVRRCGCEQGDAGALPTHHDGGRRRVRHTELSGRAPLCAVFDTRARDTPMCLETKWLSIATCVPTYRHSKLLHVVRRTGDVGPNGAEWG